jgi:NAD+ synthase (glutamine-hydrolysing)
MYGDMCGALGVISDINKLEVYKLSRWVNRSNSKIIIPENSINKKPSAELSEDQYDPFDYDIVSPLVDYIINDLADASDLLNRGYKIELINDIINKINTSEYKRRQAPPGIKVSKKAFGMGRRYPMNNHYRHKK